MWEGSLEVTLRFLDFILKDEGIPLEKVTGSGFIFKDHLGYCIKNNLQQGVKADARRPDTIINPGKMWWQLGAGALSLGWCKWPDFLYTMKIGLKGFVGGIFVPCEKEKEKSK